MKRLIRELGDYKSLYRDDTSGIAWIEDGGTGMGITIHSSIDSSGSVRGMKQMGFWRKNDRIIRSHGWIYNIDTLIVDHNNPLEKLLAYKECKCRACIERRGC